MCLVFEDHPSVSIQGTFVRALATYKRKTNRYIRIVTGGCYSATHPAGETMLINETVPIFMVGELPLLLLKPKFELPVPVPTTNEDAKVAVLPATTLELTLTAPPLEKVKP